MSPHPWTAERLTAPDQALGVIREQHRGFGSATVALLAQGWDNDAFRVTAEPPGAPPIDAVFRFPRREIAVSGIRRELVVLPVLASVLPLPIPVPRWSGSWADEPGEPWPYWGASLLAGTELAQSGLSDGHRAGVAAAMGGFLRALHGYAPAPAVTETLQHDPLGRAFPARRTSQTVEALQRLADAGHPTPTAAVRVLLKQAAELAEPPIAQHTVCHGDLHARHVLVAHRSTGGDSSTVSGVLDWGDVCLADPAIDLSLAFAAFTGHARRAFLDAYGPVPAERELRARALGIFIAARLAEYGLDLAAPGAPGSVLLLEDSLRSISRAVEK